MVIVGSRRADIMTPGFFTLTKRFRRLRLRSQLLLLTWVLPALCGVAAAAPIHDAVQAGDAQQVARLIADGADVNAQRADGVTPLHWAAQDGRIEIVRTLLAHGADPSVRTGTGWTAAHFAAAAGHRDILALLREKGSNRPTRRTSPPARTPAAKPAASAGGHRVQLAALRSGSAPAQKERRRLKRKIGRYLGGTDLIVRTGQGKNGPVYRIQTEALSKKKARQICRTLKQHGQSCLVVRSSSP